MSRRQLPRAHPPAGAARSARPPAAGRCPIEVWWCVAVTPTAPRVQSLTRCPPAAAGPARSRAARSSRASSGVIRPGCTGGTAAARAVRSPFFPQDTWAGRRDTDRGAGAIALVRSASDHSMVGARLSGRWEEFTRGLLFARQLAVTRSHCPARTAARSIVSMHNPARAMRRGLRGPAPGPRYRQAAVGKWPVRRGCRSAVRCRHSVFMLQAQV